MHIPPSLLQMCRVSKDLSMVAESCDNEEINPS